MKKLILLFAAISLSACVTERRATFNSSPGPLPLSEPLSEPLLRSWALGEVFVTPEPLAPMQQYENWSKGRSQIEERLRETLSRQTHLGRRADSREEAELIVDVDVRLREGRAINGWFAPAILSEVAVLTVGAGTGAGIGWGLAGANREESAAIGSLAGVGIAILPAVIVPLLFPTNDVVASADAKLTFRRAHDGVVIYEKQTRAEWVDQHNSFGVEEKLAKITGAGIEALEREVVKGLFVGLRSSPPANAVAKSREQLPLLPSDAPTRLLLVAR